ncbi:MAG TPA: serine/threonine-protein kinase [Anaeromyxobacteraceae bacterium]
MPTCPMCRTVCDEAATSCPNDGTSFGPPDALLGKIVGDRYRLLARIGEGGMGTVYRAEHIVLRKRMAVKVLRPELSLDEDLVRRFQQEAIAASQIGQENIVDVTDFGRTAQGSLYFVMEELEGASLATVLRAGPLPVERAALLLAQVCRALAAAHAHGIVHRDLKPDNVIVVRREDGSDFVKVVDFGISKNGAGKERERVTRAGTIIGTPEYMAPEQGAAATVDHRADIYAFGVLAYELVTGTLPFQGESAIATLLEHQTKAPEPPSRRRPGLPPDVEALILKALEKRPEARQQSMAEVAVDLTRVLASFELPPVYERAPTPPPTLGSLGGFTERFARPTHERFRTTGRGATVAIEDGVGEVAARETIARRGSRAALAVVLSATIAVLAAAAIAWRSASSAQSASAPRTSTSSVSSPSPWKGEGRGEGWRTQGPAPLPNTPPASGGRGTEPPMRIPTALVASAGAPQSATAPPPRKKLRRAAASRPGRQVGDSPGIEENPYDKLDDLKPNPF